MQYKICSKCGKELERTQFSTDNAKRDKLRNSCKACDSIHDRAYAATHKKQARARSVADWQQNKDKLAARGKRWRETNRESYAASRKIKYYENHEKNLELNRRFRETHREYCARKSVEYSRNRYHTDPLFKFTCSIRVFIRSALRRAPINCNKTSKTTQILGCTRGELRVYLESKFAAGMSWDDRSAWHIDHIIPLASAKTEADVIRLNHYTNLQPLWAVDNIRKGARYEQSR